MSGLDTRSRGYDTSDQNVIVGPVDPAQMDEIEVLARTLYGEARGEPGAAGARKILRVLVGQRRHSCLHQTLPFSCWNVDDPNRPKLLTVEAKDRNYQSCMRIARRAVRGALADRTGGATHYHAKGVFPPWARGRMYSAEIGRHQFYAGIE